jgi:hypothetical protein
MRKPCKLHPSLPWAPSATPFRARRIGHHRTAYQPDHRPADCRRHTMLHIEYADLYANGAKLPHGSITGGPVGPQFAMYLEDSGVVDGSRLKFVQSYELKCTGPILSTRGSEVWVFHDPQFRPKTAGTGPVQWGAESAMKMWLRKEDDEHEVRCSDLPTSIRAVSEFCGPVWGRQSCRQPASSRLVSVSKSRPAGDTALGYDRDDRGLFQSLGETGGHRHIGRFFQAA